MNDITTTHYYVEIKDEGKEAQILYHTHDLGKDEYYYKFMRKAKALALINDERLTHPNTTKFRIVKCTTSRRQGEWY